MRFLHVSYPLRRELCSFPAADVWLRTRKQALSDSSRCWSFAWSIWSDTWLCRRPQKAGKKALLEVACPTPRPGKIENNCLVVDLKGCVLGHRSYATGDSLKRVSVHVQEAPWSGKQTLQKRLYCIVSICFCAKHLEVPGWSCWGGPQPRSWNLWRSNLGFVSDLLGPSSHVLIRNSKHTFIFFPASDANGILQDGHEVDQNMMINHENSWDSGSFPNIFRQSHIDSMWSYHGSSFVSQVMSHHYIGRVFRRIFFWHPAQLSEV